MLVAILHVASKAKKSKREETYRQLKKVTNFLHFPLQEMFLHFLDWSVENFRIQETPYYSNNNYK
jgi:hypothetical protein